MKKLMSIATTSLFTLLFYIVLAGTAHAQYRANCMCDGNAAYEAESINRAQAITRVMPVYPEEALRQGIQGTVEILIDRDNVGRVARAKIDPQTHPLLRRAAAEAVRGWRFRPRVINPDHPRPRVCTLTFLTFNFIIEQGQGRVEMFEIPEGFLTAGRPTGIFTYTDHQNWGSWEDILRSLP